LDKISGKIADEITKIKNSPDSDRQSYARIATFINKKFKVKLIPKEVRDFWRSQFYEKPKGKEGFLRGIEKRELISLRKQQTFFEIVGNAILTATKALEADYKIPEPKRSKGKTREEMNLMISDVHAGLTVDAEESGGLGSFNVKVLLGEMGFYKASLDRIFNIHFKETIYDVCNIYLVGDLIEGKILRESQLRTTDLAVVEQIMLVVDELTKIVAWIATKFPMVNVYSVCGNHSRLTKKTAVLSPFDHLDYLIAQWMKQRLEGFRNVKFNISKSWWMLIERMGCKLYMEHGDDFFSWLGIPFYGIKRGKGNIREVLREYLDEKGRPVDFDYFLVAHIHQPSEFSKIITNGGWTGGTEYSLKRLKTGSPASQKVFSIHPRFKKTWSRDIMLKDTTKQRVKIYS